MVIALNLLCASGGYLELVDLLLKDKRVDPTVLRNITLMDAITEGHPDVVERLIKDKRIDPTAYNNSAILLADFSKRTDIIQVLWKNKKVKDTLGHDNNELYNKFMTKDIKNKAEHF